MRPCTSSKLANDGNYPDLQPAARANLSSTIDYHRSLLDQHRQQHESTRSSRIHTQPCHPSPNHSRGSIRQWLPLSNTKKTGPATYNNNKDKDATRKCNKTKNEKDHSSLESSSPPPPYPHLTRKDLEEFEALPVAIRRKYFSTLERLRLAQSSGILDHPKDHNEHREHGNADNQFHRRHKLRGASLSTDAALAGKPLGRPITSPSYRVRDHAHAHAVSVDTAFLAKLPAKIREKHLTREEQVIVAKQLRPSVILDAADEAILKVGRASRRPSPPPVYPPTLSSSARPSMDSLASDNAFATEHDALYDSFRWLDEDEDLDLRLTLDDYHVNLRETVPVLPKEVRPPSFRRHLSFSKIPFGRTSISSSRPGTKDAAHPVPNSPIPNPVVYPQNGRRKSRALSLITPKHTAHESITSIDPAATHYQDPEARLKLRVYLASPQKFDEAIEFGFPANGASTSPYGDIPSAKGHRRGMLSTDSEKFKTFLADDQSSTCSDDASLPDPESPRTPQTLDKHVKPFQPSGTDDYHSSRAPDSYAQAPAASREMTLRMTLTRPDLRACEDQMYGWQKGTQQYPGKLSQTWSSRDDTPTSAYAKDGPKESMDKIFADIDHELGLTPSTDGNVVKRFWNRVRRN
ncbi:DNA-directed RNA polymerase II subunit [Hypoxylon texense]